MNLQENIRRILREEIEIPLYIRRRYHCIDDYITKLENGEETRPIIIGRQFDWINYQIILTALIRKNCGDENFYYDPRIHSKIMDVFGKRLHKWYEENIGKQEQNEGEISERCWKGYTKKGMKTMFGKRYPNCVKKTNR